MEIEKKTKHYLTVEKTGNQTSRDLQTLTVAK